MYKKIQIVLAILMILSVTLTACGAPAPTQAPTTPPEVVQPTAVPPTAAPTATAKPAEPTATLQAGQPTVAPTPTEVISSSATGVVYKKKDSIFGGKPIKLALWDWFDVRANYYTAQAAEYKKMYPNVDIEVTILPWDEFWTKLTASLPAGQGPDIYQFHNAYHDTVVANGYAAPYPKDLFDVAYMEKHWVGMKTKDYHDAQGNIAYLPNGEMTGLLYINKTMWDAAGLTEKDYPKTWDELRAVAKKLTKTDASGKIQVAGWSGFGNDFTWANWYDMILQQGRFLFTADHKGCQFDSPEAKKGLHELESFFDDKVNTKDFLLAMDGFGAEKIAMIDNFAWISGVMVTGYPNVKYFVIPEPTFTGEDLPSRGYFNYEAGVSVNAKISDDRKAVAFDFVHWLFSDPQKLVDMNIIMGVAPAYDQNFKDPRILAIPEVKISIDNLPYKIFKGEDAWPLESQLIQSFDQAIIAGKSEDEIITGMQQICNKVMLQNPNFLIRERSYQYADKMIPNQP